MFRFAGQGLVFVNFVWLGTAASRPLEKSLNKPIAWLDKQRAYPARACPRAYPAKRFGYVVLWASALGITEIDADLTKRLRRSDVWRAKDNLLRGIPGVGTAPPDYAGKMPRSWNAESPRDRRLNQCCAAGQ